MLRAVKHEGHVAVAIAGQRRQHAGRGQQGGVVQGLLRGLHGGPEKLAVNRRARLVEHAVATRLVTPDMLYRLEDPAAYDDAN